MFILLKLNDVRVDECMYLKIEKTIKRAEKRKQKNKLSIVPVLLVLKSKGGHMEWAAKINELLMRAKNSGIEFYAYPFEYVHSAALIVYLSCPFRIGKNKNISFLFHRAKQNGLLQHKKIEYDCMKYVTKMTNLSPVSYFKLANNNTYVQYSSAIEYKIINLDLSKEKTLQLV